MNSENNNYRNEIRLQQIDVNLLGRDFICGDIHGSYNFVIQFLKYIDFDKTKDRLFTCGDIIDKGPQNEDCLRLLDEPWFYSVLGNHEQLMIEYAANEYYGQYWPKNGGRWGTKYFPSTQIDPWDYHITEYNTKDFNDIRRLVFQKVSQLPHIITVNQKNGKKFHIIHAEFSPNSNVTDEILADPELAKNVAFDQTDDGDSIIWGRYIFNRVNGEDLTSQRTINKLKKWAKNSERHKIFNNNLSLIYSGHTPIQRPVKFYGQINLDTMAYEAATIGKYNKKPSLYRGLSFINPDSGECWLSNHLGVKTQKIVVID